MIAPGAVVMAMIYAWGPLSGLHINPAVTFAFTARGVFPTRWVVPYWVVRFAGAICAALFLQLMFDPHRHQVPAERGQGEPGARRGQQPAAGRQHGRGQAKGGDHLQQE